jgi:dihydroorotate dehydrogenase
LYKRLRPLLFLFSGETSHNLTFGLLRLLYHLPGVRNLMRMLFAARMPLLPTELMGLRFANPVGLGAGLDKNALYIAPLTDLGFGWLELGTVTPRPQPGNPKKRIFRLVRERALINRMGFNNHGVEAFVSNLTRQRRAVPIGINIGKNATTPIENAIDDYLAALRAVHAQADYVTVNISSPNTAGLRDLQGKEPLDRLLGALKAEQARLAAQSGRRVPIALKIAPDLDDTQIAIIAELLLAHCFDAVIATNTTVSRPILAINPVTEEPGGLSGAPLTELSTSIIRKLYGHLRGRVPIIGVGGISTVDEAWEKLLAGAEVVQIYTALIYEGPGVVQSLVRGLAERVQATGATDLKTALARAREPFVGELDQVNETVIKKV